VEANSEQLVNTLSLPVDADILCYTPEEIERMKTRAFIRKILKEEVVLYEK